MGYDIIVIGAGHNGLVAAARLSAAGRRVLVLERGERPGGLCAAEEFHPGFTASGVLHDTGGLHREVVRGLGLAKHGLSFRAAPPVLVPDGDRPGVVLDFDTERGRAAIETVSANDARAWDRWRSFLDRVRPPVRALLAKAPPDLDGRSPSDLWDLARDGLSFRLLGAATLTEILRLAPMCVADWLNELFETPLIKAALAAPAVESTFLGPWSAGSATNLLVCECGRGRPVEGGPPALVRALVAACSAAGAELRTGCEVSRIRLDGGRVAGVALVSGEEIDAPIVAASCDPKQTFLELLAPTGVPAGLQRQIEVFRCRGTSAKVNLAIAGELELAGRPGERFEAIRLAGADLDDLERAFDAVKYRRYSARPCLDVRVPSIADPSLAPAGHHVVSILASYAPFDLEGGWSDARREELGDAVVSALAAHAPRLREQIVHREVLSPADLAGRYRLAGGHLHHGEHALDQLFLMRPTPDTARYRTPVEGLFLAGSGSHPGGGVTGGPGWLAARSILRR